VRSAGTSLPVRVSRSLPKIPRSTKLAGERFDRNRIQDPNLFRGGRRPSPSSRSSSGPSSRRHDALTSGSHRLPARPSGISATSLRRAIMLAAVSRELIRGGSLTSYDCRRRVPSTRPPSPERCSSIHETWIHLHPTATPSRADLPRPWQDEVRF